MSIFILNLVLIFFVILLLYLGLVLAPGQGLDLNDSLRLHFTLFLVHQRE